MRAAIIITAALALTGCSTTAQPIERGGPQTAEMAQECRERGGVLVPSGRPISGRPEVDNICKIDNGATRIPPQ